MSPKKNKNIFTYIPSNTPFYTNLCLKTWEINKPKNYNIIILNSQNISQYLPKDLMPLNFTTKQIENFSFTQDFVASLVLYNYGGIFLEPNIIMTDKFKTNEILLKNTGLVVFSDNRYNICQGFMMGNKNSKILEELIRRYNFMKYIPIEIQNSRNFILNDVVKRFAQNDVLIVNIDKSGYYIDKSMYSLHNEYLYKKYFYTNASNTDDFFELCKGLCYLNNNFIPEEYKNMKQKDFLKKDILLAQIFKKILNI